MSSARMRAPMAPHDNDRECERRAGRHAAGSRAPRVRLRRLPAAQAFKLGHYRPGTPKMYAEPDDRVGAERGADERQPDKRQHAADLRVARYRRPQWLQRDRVNDGQPRQVSEDRPLEAGGPRVLEPTVVLLPHGARRRVTA